MKSIRRLATLVVVIGVMAGSSGQAVADLVSIKPTDDGTYTETFTTGFQQVGHYSFAADTTGSLTANDVNSGNFVFKDDVFLFSLAGVPAGATIASATLTYYASANNTNNANISLYTFKASSPSLGSDTADDEGQTASNYTINSGTNTRDVTAGVKSAIGSPYVGFDLGVNVPSQSFTLTGGSATEGFLAANTPMLAVTFTGAPEPSSLALAGVLGVLGWAGHAWKRRAT